MDVDMTKTPNHTECIRCGHNVRVPAFEKHKVTGLLALNLF